MRRHQIASAALPKRDHALAFAFVLALAIALLAIPAHAQAAKREAALASPPGTVLHVVRRGDTLADIARRFLGDYRRWPELFKSNAGQIKDANLIFPGQRLYVGADGKPTFNAPAVAAKAEPVETTPARTVVLGRNTTGQSNSLLDNATLSGRTVRPTVRRGEVAAAPFLMPVSAKTSHGEVVARADPTVAEAATTRDQFQLFDDVDVLLPVGVSGAVGQQFGVYQLGPEIRHAKIRSNLVQPSGVVQLVALGSGRAARARVTSLFANMRKGDMLMALDTTSVLETVRPSDVANGPVYEVAYVAGGVVLPTVQNYVVIALPAGARSRVGDQFSLFTDGARLTDSGRDIAPSNEVAQVSVVRVTAESATAVVVGHLQPAIRAGMKARLVSRMP